MNAPHVRALATWFETLTPETLARLPAHYAIDARFKDPFNEVQGTAAIERIFEHMFSALTQPRFEVTEIMDDVRQAFMTWRFHFGLGSRQFTVSGATHFRFDANGLVTLHRDYWDTGEELYSRLPGIGLITRWLQRRLRTPI